MPNIGYATLVIIPTARGISRKVHDQIVSPVAAAGRTAGDRAGAGIRDGVDRTNYSRAGNGMVNPVAHAGHRAGQQAGRAIQRGIEERNYEQSGRDAGGRFVSGFSTGVRGLGAAFNIGTAGLRLFVVNAGTIGTAFGIAAKIVKSFSAATFVSAVLLKQVAATGLTKLAGALRIIAAIASRVAKEIGQITSAFLVLQGVVRVIGFMTNFAKKLAIITVGSAAAIGVVSGLATIVGGALSTALTAGALALGAFAGAAAGIGGPAIFALKVGMKGLADGASDFNKQFSDADEAFNKMIGQRMGPMLTAVRTLRMEMVDRFSAELTPAFQRIGVGIDQVRGKFGWMSVYMGQIGQDIAMSLTGPGTIEAFQKMGDASGVFFQHLNKGESGLGGLSAGLVTFASTAAVAFQDSSRGLNDLFLDLGMKLRTITPEQIRGALAQFRQVFTNISNVAGPLFNLFRQLGQISAQGLAPGFVAVGNAIREATPALLNMSGIIMPALGQVMTNLAPLIPRLVEAFTPWATTLATIAPHLASLVAHMAPLAPYLLIAVTAFKALSAAMLVFNAIGAAAAITQGVMAAATGAGTAAIRRNTIAMGAYASATAIGAVASRAFGAAMAFATGPIGLIVLAVAAVGAALWAFFTKTEVGKQLWEKIWSGIKAAVSAAWEFLKVAWAGILVGIQWIGDKATWLWTSVFQPVFGFIGSLISAWWSGIVRPAFEGVKAAIGFVGDAISWWWQNIVTPAFAAAGAAIAYFWDNFGSPIFNNFMRLIGLVGDAISWWWNSIAVPGFQAVGAVLGWFWDSVASPVFEQTKTGISLVGDAFSFFKDNVIDPVFSGIGSAISFAWENVVSPIFDKLKSGIGLVGDAFGTAGGVIKSMWSGVADALRPAVHALGGLLTKVPSSIAGFEIPGAGAAQDLGRALQAFRTGGTVGAGRTGAGVLYGPGTGTSDSILGVDTAGIPTALVSTGEGVVRESAMEAGGDRLVAALNAGWTPSAEALAALFPELNRYATGGKVTRAQFLDQLRGIEGAAYDFGGWGNGWVTDCSGAQAKAANLIAYGDTETGGRFGTGTMARALADRGAQPGLGGAEDYNLAWYNGGPWGGHTAGSLPGGIGFEMGGQRGNGQFGGAAAKATDSKFTDAAHFPASMFAGGGVSAGTNAATTPPSSSTTPTTDTATSSTTDTATSTSSQSRLKTFDELGSDFATIFRDGLLETVGLDGGIWTDPQAWLTGDTGDNVRTTDSSSSTGTNPSAPAAETVAPSSSTGTGTGDANTATPIDPRTSLTGAALYSYDIARAARDMGLGEAAAVIGNAVGLVETELKMYANSTVPESLSFPHDAVGSDSDSLGVMQQRATWGSVADRMNSPTSARLFLEALRDIPDWESMDPGAAAQAVQRSAFPDKYGARLDEARTWVRKAGLFDTGGMLAPGGLAVSMLTKPEPLLPADKWDIAESNIAAVDRLVTTITANGGRGTVQRGGDTYNAFGYTAGDIANEWQRRQWARTGGYDGRGW